MAQGENFHHWKRESTFQFFFAHVARSKNKKTIVKMQHYGIKYASNTTKNDQSHMHKGQPIIWNWNGVWSNMMFLSLLKSSKIVYALYEWNKHQRHFMKPLDFYKLKNP
jgi:hypothetical protein